jgi:Co/Zn/Cd efflux system component
VSIAFLALIANVTCLALISKHRDGGAHMKASWIFSANDVLINAGVMVAGALLDWTGSHYPGLVIGTFIGVVVLNGARRILALKGCPTTGCACF